MLIKINLHSKVGVIGTYLDRREGMLMILATVSEERAIIGIHVSKLDPISNTTLRCMDEDFFLPDTMDPDSNGFRRAEITLLITLMYAATMTTRGMRLIRVRTKKLYCQPCGVCDENVNKRQESGISDLNNPETGMIDKSMCRIQPMKTDITMVLNSKLEFFRIPRARNSVVMPIK